MKIIYWLTQFSICSYDTPRRRMIYSVSIFLFFFLPSVFIILIIKWTLCDTPCGHAVAFTIKRFLRPESDVENNIIYFEYLLGTFSPPPPPYRPLTVCPCIRWYIIIYPRHHYTMSLCLDSRPALDFRLTARAANKVHACRRGGENEGFLHTFIEHYNIYIIYVYIRDTQSRAWG